MSVGVFFVRLSLLLSRCYPSLGSVNAFSVFCSWTMDSDENDGDRGAKRRQLLLTAVEGASTSGLGVSPVFFLLSCLFVVDVNVTIAVKSFLLSFICL